MLRSVPAPRRRIAAAVIAVAILLLIVVLLLLRPWDRTAAAAAPQTVWQAISSEMTGEDVPVATALKAYAYLTGLDIPRVQIPAGVRGDDTPTSASGALRWVRANWAQVAPDQQAAIEASLAPQPGDLVIPVTGPDGEEIASASRVATADGGVPGGLVPTKVSSDTEAATIAEAIRADVFVTITHIGQKLGLPVIREGLFVNDVTLVLAHWDKGTTFWETFAKSDGTNYTPCNLVVYKNLWSKEVAGQPLSPTMHVTLTHEIIHCYQNQVIGDIDSAFGMPKWIMEGSAIWLAGNDTGIVEPMTPGMYRTHILGKPERALTGRTYDAYGWYALLDHLGRPMWSLFADAWRAAARSTGAGRSEAFIAVLEGDADDVERAWAPAFARESSWNDPWITYGLGLPADATAPRIPVRATGAGYLSSLPDRSNQLVTVTGSDGEIVVVETDGLASVHDGALDSELAFTSRRFCVDGDCVCPPRTQRAGERMADEEMHLPFIVAFQSPAGGAGQRISSRTLAEECGRADSPAPSSSSPRPSGKPPVASGHRPPTCGTRCPGSNGDPHLRTVNGIAYDFQAAGEFTLLRTPDGLVDVQVRQEPATGVEFGRVSNNTALAVRLGDRRVAIYTTAAGLDVRLDGVVQRGADPLDVGAGRVERHEQGIAIDLPDGTVIWALGRPPSGIYVLVDPSARVMAEGVGLLGPTADGLGIPRLPDGTALPSPLDRHEAYQSLYVRFADAWRVTDATTLFDYDPGKTSASYTIADYPAAPKIATFIELASAEQAAGRAACADVADTELRDQCAYDVVVTGDRSYVRPYVTVERLAERGSAALDEPAAAPGAHAPVEVLPVIHRLAGSALDPDGILYVSAVMADRSGVVVAIDPLTGRILHETPVTGSGEVDVAAGSVWVAELDAPATGGPSCSVARLDPSTLAVQATIPTACQGLGLGTDLAAVGGDVWFVDPSGADAAGAGGVLRRIDPATNRVAATVPIPFVGGTLRASAAALFYGDPTKGQFRLRPGETALARIGNPGTEAFPAGWPAGDGLWAVTEGGLGFFSAATGPSGTIDLNDADGGILVGADTESVFIERRGTSGTNELWRRYLDGRVPVRLATATTAATGIGPLELTYVEGGAPSLFVSERALTKVWVLISRTNPAESLLLVQGAGLPTP
ncbi:MAG: hypothetical protein H0U52_03435 [Chloroflexi bacterium]|nr:hypothetical protein [Chloroflexota bacterium]